jgi:DNA-binding transcriptional regulator of glucitol operon
MNFWMILLAAQVIVTVLAFARGTKQDTRFQEDKLDFRS